MTISLGLLLLIAGLFAWKMKGAQMPHLILGALIMKAAAPDSIVDRLGASGVEIVQAIVTQVADAFGQTGVV